MFYFFIWRWGGGSIVTVVPNVSSGKVNIEPSLLQVTLKKGEVIQKTLKIKNSKDSAVNLKFSLSNSLNQFASIPSNSLTLNTNSEGLLSINFFSHEKTAIGVYTGKIIVDDGNFIREIPVVINVNDRKSLFDIGISLDNKNIKSGQDLGFNLNLFNLGETGRVDAIVEYLIKDFEGNVIAKKEETVAVETRASLNNKFNIPLNLVSGKYSIAAIVKYGNFSGVSSDTFEVINGIRYFFVIIFILIVLILGIIFYFPIRTILNRKIALDTLKNSLKNKAV